MKTAINLKKSLKGYLPFIFVIRYILGAFALFALAFILLKFPETSADGVRNGIDLCLAILVPTLYPFMILTNVFVNSGIINKTPDFIRKIMNCLFKLPGECACVIFFSMIGGLPVGAKMAQKLYERKTLTADEGQRMLYFCVNPGPAFVISSVGYYMLGSKEIGLLIYLSLVASSLTLGIMTRFINNGTEYIKVNKKYNAYNKNIFQASVSDASKSIITVCSWVVAFSCITEIIEKLSVSDTAKIFLQCITEMTNGCRISAENFSVPIIAGVIGFGGVCAHFQLMDSIIAMKMKYKYFLVGRILNGSIATLYCSLLLKWIPIANETFSAGVRPNERGMSASFFVSLLMILMAVLFIIGDDYSVKRKEKSKTKNKV